MAKKIDTIGQYEILGDSLLQQVIEFIDTNPDYDLENCELNLDNRNRQRLNSIAVSFVYSGNAAACKRMYSRIKHSNLIFAPLDEETLIIAGNLSTVNIVCYKRI